MLCKLTSRERRPFFFFSEGRLKNHDLIYIYAGACPYWCVDFRRTIHDQSYNIYNIHLHDTISLDICIFAARERQDQGSKGSGLSDLLDVSTPMDVDVDIRRPN